MISKDQTASSSLRCPNIPKEYEVYQRVSSFQSLLRSCLMSVRSLEDAHHFILCSKILCCDNPPVKEQKMGFLILFGQWGSTCQVTNLFSFTIEHNILFSYVTCPHSVEYEMFHLRHSSKK